MAARDVIGRLPVIYDPQKQSIIVENSVEFVKTQIRQKLDEQAHGKPLRLTLTVERYRKKRSLEQNRMMWALLTIMSDAYNAGQGGGMTPEACYIQMLEEFGLEYYFLEIPQKALPAVRQAFKLVYVVELLNNDRCTVKASMGSSSFSTAQMTDFINRIFDRLAEMGVNDPNVTACWMEWQEVPKK